MALSDQEIKALLEKAKSYEDSADEAGAKGSGSLQYFEQALSCYNKIIESIPNNHYYYERRSNVKYVLAGKSSLTSSSGGSYLESAIDDISKAIELEPDRGKHYRLRGYYCFAKLSNQRIVDEQLSKRSIEDYQTCISKDPTQPRVWLNLLGLNLSLRNYDEAISVYGQCKSYISDKEDQLIRAWLGCIVFIMAGDSVEEEDIKPLYNQEIRLNRVTLIGFTIPTLKRLLEKERNEECRKKVNELNELLFSHIDDWLRRGFLLRELGCYEEALKAYDKAIELNPNNALAWNNKAGVLSVLNRHEEAIKVYDKAIESKPDDANLWSSKGHCLGELWRLKEAIEACDKAIELDSNHAMAYINKSHRLGQLGCHEEALKACDRAVELEPNNAMVWNNKGWNLGQLGRHEEALEALDKAIELDPNCALAKGNKDSILGKPNRH